MFDAIRYCFDKLIEVIPKLTDSYFEKKDAQFGLKLIELNNLIQDIYINGDNIYQFLINICKNENFDSNDLPLLLQAQFSRLKIFQETIISLRNDLSTVSPNLFIEIMPLINSKSGIITRILLEYKVAPLSTNTIFYLPYQEIDEFVKLNISKTYSHSFLGMKSVQLRKSGVENVLNRRDRIKLLNIIKSRNIENQLEKIKAISINFNNEIEKNIGLKKIRRKKN